MPRPKKPVRLVIDTNLMVAAYFNPRSASAKIIELCADESSFMVAYTATMQKETDFILANIRASDSFKNRIKEVFSSGFRVEKVKSFHLVKDDPADNEFLDCALAAKVSYLITNDHHLLKLRSVNGVEIVRPTDFVGRLKSEE